MLVLPQKGRNKLWRKKGERKGELECRKKKQTGGRSVFAKKGGHGERRREEVHSKQAGEGRLKGWRKKITRQKELIGRRGFAPLFNKEAWGKGIRRLRIGRTEKGKEA